MRVAGHPVTLVGSRIGVERPTGRRGHRTGSHAGLGTVAAQFTYSPYDTITPGSDVSEADVLLRYSGALDDARANYTHLGQRWDTPPSASSPSKTPRISSPPPSRQPRRLRQRRPRKQHRPHRPGLRFG